MSKLVMTIDSDSDIGETKPTSKQLNQKNKKQKKQSVPLPSTEEDEDIQLSKEFQLTDENDFYKGFRANTVNPQNGKFAVGDNKSIWSFQDTIRTDQQRKLFNEELKEQNEQQNVKTLEEKVKQILEDYDIQISDNEQDATKQPPQQKLEIKKADAKHHYDKEDMISFPQLFISKPLVKACSDLDYEHPTVIQRKVIPAIIEGNDILAHAVTGSGKTASYLLPILEKYLRVRAANKGGQMGKIRYLILQPVRELAAQCYSMCQSLTKYLPKDSFNASVVFGGSSLAIQKRELENQPDMVIGTIGRLLDHIHNTKGFNLEDIDVLVLDEADKLLEMGFKEELLEILKSCNNPKRQTIMVSATLNQDIKELAQLALKQPLQFTVSQQQKLADSGALRLTQYIVRLPENLEKVPKTKLIKKEQPEDEINDEDLELEEEAIKEPKKTKKDKLDNSSDDEEDDEDMEDDDEEKDVNAEEELDSEDSDPYGDEGLDSDDSDDSQTQKKKRQENYRHKQNNKKNFPVIQLDPYLIRREATLINLVKKHFKQRVIIFFNEKAQCHRMMILFKIYGLDATEVHGNLTQEERMQNIEKFQNGHAEYLLATDLVARGLDLPMVKTVINFSFPTEPKRYLHRIGRTARAGSHGVAITICNDEERKEIKKLTRKLGQQVNTYSMNSQQVKKVFTKISSQLDQIVKEVSMEEKQDNEIQQGFKDAKRAENMIKYKDEIMNRPRNVWQKSAEDKKENKQKSKEELGKIKTNFDDYQNRESKDVKKRDKKQREKEKKKALKPGESRFQEDFEQDKEEKPTSNKAQGLQQDKLNKMFNKSGFNTVGTGIKYDKKTKRTYTPKLSKETVGKGSEAQAKLRKGRREDKNASRSSGGAGSGPQKSRGEKWRERNEKKFEEKDKGQKGKGDRGAKGRGDRKPGGGKGDKKSFGKSGGSKGGFKGKSGPNKRQKR